MFNECSIPLRSINIEFNGPDHKIKGSLFFNAKEYYQYKDRIDKALQEKRFTFMTSEYHFSVKMEDIAHKYISSDSIEIVFSGVCTKTEMINIYG